MSDMKCPFCQQELKYDAWNEVYMCRNPNCKHLLGFGTKELWQELMRTKKQLVTKCNQLDVAVDALDRMAIDDNVSGMIARNAIKEIKALEQITALEQKD